jgi:hypothetical protein
MKQVTPRQSIGRGGAYISDRSAPKVEPRAKAMNPAGVSQLGTALGNHATTSNGKVLKGAAVPLERGPGYEAKGPRPMSATGPGAGRDVHKSGSQGAHGSNPGEKPGQPRPIIEPMGGQRVTK